MHFQDNYTTIKLRQIMKKWTKTYNGIKYIKKYRGDLVFIKNQQKIFNFFCQLFCR